MYDWTTTETSRLRRQQLLRDIKRSRTVVECGGARKRRSSIPSAIGWELVRQLGRARKLLWRLRARE